MAHRVRDEVTAELPTEEYSELEAAAYEAAIIPELWPKVLSKVGVISDSVGAALVALNERGVHIVCAPAMDNVCRRIISEGYMSRSGRADGVVGKGLVGVPRFLNEHDYYDSLEDAETDPVVTEVFRQEGMGWAAGWMLQLPHVDLLIMNVEQYYDRGPIVGEALARLDSFYPIFARAAMLSARADFARVQTAVETLGSVGLPAVAVTPTGRVVIANDAFSQATHIWTTGGGNRCALHDRVADRMLTEALSLLEAVRSPRSIPVRSETGGEVKAVVQVVPVRRAAHDIFGSTEAILVLSEAKEGLPQAALIQSIFDLTPSEIAVAQAIAAGRDVTDIARVTGRSVHTVRNHLRSIMVKTGTSRQAELAVLIRQLGR
jgi:DNA-binding CsgD family transcriptional regulator